MVVAVAEHEPLVGQALRHARQRLGISAKEASRRARLSPSYVSKVERGECAPSLETFAAMVIALQMSPLEVWATVVLAFLSHPSGLIGDTRFSSAQEGGA